MLRTAAILLTLLLTHLASAQYVLKDHRDSIGDPQLYDSLEVMADSFFSKMRFQHVRTIKLFTPSLAALKSTYDTLSMDYNQTDLMVKQQLIQKKLEQKYKKVLKQAKRDNIKFRKFEKKKTEYEYGISEEGYEFCYVTITCTRRSKEMTIKFLAMKLNGYWYVGDELHIFWL